MATYDFRAGERRYLSAEIAESSLPDGVVVLSWEVVATPSLGSTNAILTRKSYDAGSRLLSVLMEAPSNTVGYQYLVKWTINLSLPDGSTGGEIIIAEDTVKVDL